MIPQNTHKIRFKDLLYGRQDKLNELKACHNAMDTNCIGLVLVKGVSGVDKTSFILNFSTQVESHDTYFVQGKLDLNRNTLPYSAILQACGELKGQLVNGGRIKAGRDCIYS